MPFATHHGHRIHYERTGRGTPVVLAHGMFSSLEGWKRNGWIDRLSTHHLVLAVDSVAHGASDCPEDPACYQRPERVADLLSVLDEEGLDGAHFVGYSMGAWMVSGVATEAPGRLLSLTVGGWDVDEGLRLPKEQFRGTAGGELTFDALAASVAAAAPILQEAMQVADRQ
ncbi:MAG TPA: alpha/beta fold hydrolase, partial [Acidimicrobiales bacterium]|nr:alpha/beta fold hydrolase [Acidimicrobiales bacterium]